MVSSCAVTIIGIIVGAMCDASCSGLTRALARIFFLPFKHWVIEIAKNLAFQAVNQDVFY